MFPSHLEYLKDFKNITWFNPCWGYYGFWKKISEFQKKHNVDFKTAWTHRDMKKNKEKYVLAMIALCMQQIAPEKYGWWFTKTSQDPPDGIIGTPSENITMRVREVEIVEYFKGSLLEVIQNKLVKKRYEPNTVLVCLLSPVNIEIFDFLSIHRELKKNKKILGSYFCGFSWV